jgi:WASH complex subunit strumpellin
MFSFQVEDWQSIYQSTAIPIPRFAPMDTSVNFIGRLAKEILRITDPKWVLHFFSFMSIGTYQTLFHCRTTTYIDRVSAWYDGRTKEEIINIKLFGKLEVCIPNMSFADSSLSRILFYDMHGCHLCMFI